MSYSVKTNTSKCYGSNNKILRECRTDDHQKQSKESTRDAGSYSKKSIANSKSCLKKTASGVASQLCKKKINRGKEVCSNQDTVDQNSRTWFQVLLDSPKKTKPDKILQTNRNNFNIPHRAKNTQVDSIETVKDNFIPKSENTKRFDLLVDMFYDKLGEMSDQNFLKMLANVRNLLDDPNLEQGNTPSKYYHKCNPLTDDDKYNIQKPVKSEEKSNKSSDVLLKALLKETKDQHKLLQDLTVQVSQLREENKTLNKLKDIRINLEAQLISRNAENKFLKKEHTKAKHLLELRDRENDDLKQRLSILRRAVNGKISHVLDNFADHSFELKQLNESIASAPSREISFDMPIRPASSSPTERCYKNQTPVKASIKTRSKINICENESLNVAENVIETSKNSVIKTDKNSETEAKLKELKENLNKLTEDLEDDVANLNANDLSLNLSDVTYKWNL